jgi:hypothetical protein
MMIDWDVPISMADGAVLRADVFRPDDGARHTVIMTLGPYAKGLAFQEGYAAMWDNLVREHQDAVAGSTNWETVDPEKWVPDGYAPAAAAPGRDLPLGGRERLLPRVHPPRRDPRHLRPPVVSGAGQFGSVRARARWPATPGHRGAHRRPGTAER